MSGEPSEEERREALRRALSGIKSSAPKPAPAPRPETDEHGETNMLQALVEAMKKGGTSISAVEPDGYAHLDRVRHGEPITDASPPAAIEALQKALRRARCQCEETGYFDDATVAAVQQFQKQSGLPANGLFDAKTLDAMDKHFGLDKKAEAPVEVVRSTHGQHMLPETGNAFLDDLAPGAVKGMHESGVPASVSIAMAVLESNWGERLVARDYRNLFALRGKGPAGSVFLREDGSPGGSTEFRRYEKAADSVADHAKLLASSYPAAMSHRDRADNFARALSGSYSQNPQYGSLLIRIMKQFDLYRFDRIRPASE